MYTTFPLKEAYKMQGLSLKYTYPNKLLKSHISLYSLLCILKPQIKLHMYLYFVYVIW